MSNNIENSQTNEGFMKWIKDTLKFNVNCNCCGNRYENNNLEDKNNEVTSTSYGSNQNLFKSSNRNISNFEIEIIPFGTITKSKGRKKWNPSHEKVLKNCLTLFGKNWEKIKLFLPDFTENFIIKKCDKYENELKASPKKINSLIKDDIFKSKNSNFNDQLDGMIESMGDLDVGLQKNNEINNYNNLIKEFSIDYFIHNNLNKKFSDNLSSANENLINQNDLELDNPEVNFENNIFDKYENNFQDIDDYELENEIQNIFNENTPINKKFSIEDVINRSFESYDKNIFKKKTFEMN